MREDLLVTLVSGDRLFALQDTETWDLIAAQKPTLRETIWSRSVSFPLDSPFLGFGPRLSTKKGNRPAL